MPKNKGPRFQWPPQGDEDRQFNPEVAASAAILEALGADIVVGPPVPNKKGGKPKWPSLGAWLEEQDSGMGGLILGGARSWNHSQLKMAARGLVFGDWGDAGKLMAMQAGRIPGEGAARFLDGEEPRSTDYDPYRWAAELIFRARGPKEIRDDAREVLRRQMALASLGAVPWTDLSGDLANAKGDLWHRGPTLSPVGERSPKTSNPDQLGIYKRFLVDGAGNEREGFAGWVADHLGIDLVLSSLSGKFSDDVADCVSVLADVPVFGEFHFVMYQGGLLVWRPEQKNPNTPSALWSFAYHAEQRQYRGWPFPPGKQRGDNAAKSMGCAIEGNVVISRARTPEGRVLEAMYPLPKSAPIWSVTVDERGARFDSGSSHGGGTVPPPVNPPPTGPDVEALVVEVAALGAQPEDSAVAVAFVRARDWFAASRAVSQLMVPQRNRRAAVELSDRLAAMARAEP